MINLGPNVYHAIGIGNVTKRKVANKECSCEATEIVTLQPS